MALPDSELRAQELIDHMQALSEKVDGDLRGIERLLLVANVSRWRGLIPYGIFMAVMNALFLITSRSWITVACIGSMLLGTVFCYWRYRIHKKILDAFDKESPAAKEW